MAPPENPRQADLAVSQGRKAAIADAMNGVSRRMLDPNRAENPPFDNRARDIGDAGGLRRRIGGLVRGSISHLETESSTIPGASHRLQRRVNFLYNPTAVSVNYGIDTNIFPPQTEHTSETAPIYGATAQTISWTLYFNRTYEVARTVTRENMGVLADVQALEYLMGSWDGSGMRATPVLVSFGSTPGGKPFAYAGWISNLDISYLQFSHRMIPTVAMVEIGMVRRFLVNDSVAPAPNMMEGAWQTLVDAISGGTSTTPRTAGPRIPATASGQAAKGGHTGGGTTTRPI